MRVQGIRWDQEHVGALEARLRSLKDDRSVQAERNLRGVVSVTIRDIGGRQHQQTLRPKVELKRQGRIVSCFIQV
jgi:hypothetical protein